MAVVGLLHAACRGLRVRARHYLLERRQFFFGPLQAPLRPLAPPLQPGHALPLLLLAAFLVPEEVVVAPVPLRPLLAHVIVDEREALAELADQLLAGDRVE